MIDNNATLFRLNQQEVLQEQRVLPAHINSMEGAFSQAANNNFTDIINVEPEKPQIPADATTEKIGLMNTVMAPNEILTQSPQGIKMPAKGEINELSQGVAGVALEAASALFGSLQDKSEQPAVQPELQNNLAMNHYPRPPSGMIAGL